MHFHMLVVIKKNRTLPIKSLQTNLCKIYCHTRLHLGFSAKLKNWQVPACKIEPRSGIILRKPTHPTTRSPSFSNRSNDFLEPVLMCGASASKNKWQNLVFWMNIRQNLVFSAHVFCFEFFLVENRISKR